MYLATNPVLFNGLCITLASTVISTDCVSMHVITTLKKVM